MRSTALFNHVNYPHDSQKTLKKRLSPYLYRRLREEIPIEILISSCTVCEIKTWFLHPSRLGWSIFTPLQLESMSDPCQPRPTPGVKSTRSRANVNI